MGKARDGRIRPWEETLGQSEPEEPNDRTEPQSNTPLGFKWLAIVVGVAVAYWAFGKLGLSLAVPPGYATAVWPPSGIALAAMLIFGYRIWPGVFLGSFAVNLGLAPSPGSIVDFFSIVPAPGLIAAGAALQAVVASWLVRNMANFPNNLAREKDVLKFMFWGGAVGCFTAALIGPAVLRVFGIVNPEDYMLNVATWWFGDTVGVLLFAPLTLVWLMGDSKEWRERRLTITLPMALAFVAAYMIIANGASWDRTQFSLKFNREAAVIGSAMQTQLVAHKRAIEALERFYAASDFVSREEFMEFTKGGFQNLSGLQALSWNPVIEHADRKRIEREMQASGFQNFLFRERGEDGVMPAAEREHYVIVFYIEPFAKNQTALGFDVASNPARKQALETARDTGKMTATARITLVQEQGRQFGALFFLPIYQSKVTLDTVMARREHLRGYAVGVFRAGDLVSAAVMPFGDRSFVYELVDRTAGEILYEDPNNESAVRRISERGMFGAELDIGWATVLDVGERQWQFTVYPTSAYIAENRGEGTWLTLIVTLVISSMVGAFILIASGRSQVLKGLVDIQTRELRKISTNLETAQRIAHLGSWEVRRRDDKTTIWWSDQVYRILGVEPSETTPNLGHFIDQAAPEDRERLKTLLDLAEAQGEGFSIEYQLITKDGDYRFVKLEVEACLSGLNAVDLAMAGTIHDITVFKQVDRMKDDFISTVSHELRTPLTSIQGSLALLRGDALGELSEEAAGILDIATRNSERLARLINELLDVEKIIAGKMVFTVSECDAVRLTRQSVESMTAFALNHGVDINFIADGAAELSCLVDPDRFHQVMANLLSNACKYSPVDSVVTVSVAADGPMVRVTISDHGPGIPEAFQNRIFGRFNQADGSDTKSHGGTGLGLAICKSLVEAMNGTIDFETSSIAGTSFWFLLPRA